MLEIYRKVLFHHRQDFVGQHVNCVSKYSIYALQQRRLYIDCATYNLITIIYLLFLVWGYTNI